MPKQVEFEKTKKFKNLAVFLTTIFSILGIAVLLITSFLEIYFNYRIQQGVIKSQQEVIAKNAAETVKGFIDDRISLLESTVRFGNLENSSQENQKLILDKLLGYDASFRQIAILNKQGEELANASRTSLLSLSTQAIEQIGSGMFSQMEQNKTFISSVYVNESTSEPMIILAVPIKDVFGDYQGALIAETNLKFMWDLVSGLKVGSAGTVYVVDKNGSLLAYRDISRVLKRENLSQLYEVSEFMNGEKDPSGGDVTVSKGITGNSVVSSYFALEVPDWSVVVEIPVAEAYDSVFQIIKLSAWLMLLVFLTTITVGIFISKKIAEPLVNLRNAAREIAKGKFDTKIEVKSKNEIGELADTFGKMASQLKIYTGKLESIVAIRTEELQKINESLKGERDNLENTKKAMLNILEDVNKSNELIEKEKINYKAERDRGEGILRYLHAIGEGVIATDTRGSIIFVNLSAAKMILRDEGSPLIGRNYASEFAFVIGRGSLPKPIDPVSMALEKSSVFILPSNCYLLVRSKKIPISGSFAPIVKEGKILGVVSVFQDITERHALEKEKDEFISIAAHQLRTPLTGIRWTIESLLDGDAGELPKEAREYLKQIFENNQRLVALVSDLLDVSKINMGKAVEKEMPINICKMIQEAVGALEGLAKERGVEISYGNVCALNPEVKAGPKHLFQVFENLLSNAIKYTPKGGIVKVDMDFKKDKVVISIADNGIGIPKKDQDKIFSKFFRASNAVLKETDGSGLGLNVVKSFIEESSGKIWFESEEGKGTTFFVELPSVKKEKLEKNTLKKL